MSIDIFNKKEIELLRTENKALKNKVTGYEELLKRRTKQVDELSGKVRMTEAGTEQLKMIMSAYFAYIVHKNGGRLKLVRKKIDRLMGKYDYQTEINENTITIKEKKR